MKAGLVVGPLEVAIGAGAGQLEDMLALGLAGHLRAIGTGRTGVVLDSDARMGLDPAPVRCSRRGDGALELRHPSIDGVLRRNGVGRVRLYPHPAVVDVLVELLVGWMAVEHGAVLLRGLGVLTDAGMQLFVNRPPATSGVAHRARTAGRTALAYPRAGSWVLAGLPQCASAGPSPSGALVAVWSVTATRPARPRPMSRAQTAAALLSAAVVPVDDPAGRQSVFTTTTDIATAVPGAEVRAPTSASEWADLDAAARALDLRDAVLRQRPARAGVGIVGSLGGDPLRPAAPRRARPRRPQPGA